MVVQGSGSFWTINTRADSFKDINNSTNQQVSIVL